MCWASSGVASIARNQLESSEASVLFRMFAANSRTGMLTVMVSALLCFVRSASASSRIHSQDWGSDAPQALSRHPARYLQLLRSCSLLTVSYLPLPWFIPSHPCRVCVPVPARTAQCLHLPFSACGMFGR